MKSNFRDCVAILGLLLAFSLSPVRAQRPLEKHQLSFDIQRRVNAHGDEFNALAKSSDGRRLFTVTEKGHVLVWSIAENRQERTLHQPSPLHLVAALADRHEFVVAGGFHFKPVNAVARKWNVETGEFVDLPGVDRDSSPLALATENTTGLIALTLIEKKVLVWDARTHKQLADWNVNGVPIAVALLGRDVYVATVDKEFFDSGRTVRETAIVKFNVDRPQQEPVNFLRPEGRAWLKLEASPDYRLLAAKYRDNDGESRVVVLDPQSQEEIGSFENESSVWVDREKLMLFEWLDPAKIVQVSPSGPAKDLRTFEQLESEANWRAFDLTGLSSNADGSRAWATYRKGPGLFEFDLTTKKVKSLIGGPSGAYALSVLTQDGETGEVLTGGGDGYVRLWKLEDFSLLKEYKVAKPDYFVSDALLVTGSRHAVVGIMHVDSFKDSFDEQKPVEVILLDLETGQQRKLFDAYSWRTRIALVDNEIIYAELGKIKFASVEGVKSQREFNIGSAILMTAISENGRWLAVIDDDQKLSVFDLKTGRKRIMSIKAQYGGPVVVTNDGRFVYMVEHEGSLTGWNTVTRKTTTHVLKKVREIHTRVDFMTLANNDQWLVTAGNHRDVGIFDRTTLEPLFYVPNTAASHYVEKVWIRGNRIIVTTDTGVVQAGVLK